MSSVTEHNSEGGTLGRLFSRILHRSPGSGHIRPDKETLRRLNAPAKLFTWQASGGAEESRTYDSLREAIAQVSANPENRTFIITESGHIIRPAQIAKLRQFIETI